MTGLIHDAARGNPAAISREGLSLVAGASPAPFGLEALRTVGIAVSDAAVGFEVSHTGTDEAGVLRLDGQMSLRVEDAIRTGFGAGVRRWRFDRYGGITEWMVTAGVSSEWTVSSWGACARIGPARDLTKPLPLEVGAGVLVHPTVGGACTLDIRQETGRPLELDFGVIMPIVDAFSVLAGVSDEPDLIGAGLELRVDRWRVTVGALWHAELGATVAVTLMFVEE